MLELQHGINSKIRTDWRAANNPWYRAIWIESAELLDHLGWKWWKLQVPDLPQVHLELVDIFHFGLSELLQVHETTERALERSSAAYIAYGREQHTGIRGIDECRQLIESFAGATLSERRFDLASFCYLAASVGLQEETMYEMYVGKNVLNAFRQDHGYQTGGYLKNWDGREDNVWLLEYAAVLEKHPSTYFDALYQCLANKYRQLQS